MFLHGGDPLVTKALSLTDAFHNGKRKTTLHTLADEIDHNVISGTDCSGNGCLSFLDQGLGISQPHVCTVGKSGNTYQVGKIFRLGIHKHLHGEISTKLRNSQAAKLAAANILRLNSKSFGAGKQRHDRLVIKGNLSGI